MSASDLAKDILTFWLEAGPAKWFSKDDAFDAEFRDRFYDAHFAAARGEYAHWLDAADSALSLILLLDQFPRNVFRGTGHMFATDPLALSYARTAIAAGHDLKTDISHRAFFYLPLVHSESLANQERAVKLYEPLGEDWLPHAIDHRDIIARFGRFPHRNPLLGRETTPEETAFLNAGGFSG
ncbi:DUF924 family protein [Asticcacaulis tiandongensis]|uniref:DUF924 family protein n=1 Tax=Asticcacaulis tiandongensis TaxID=2565365 RepID=UPI00112EBD70|nr:DUF924 family protein [Asticcacaulis tiandongensis]